MRSNVLCIACSLWLVPLASAQEEGGEEEGTEAEAEAGPASEPEPPLPPPRATPSTATAGSGEAEPGADPGAGAGAGGSSGGATQLVVNVHERPRDEEEEPPPQSAADPHELQGESYHHLGVFARGIFAPQFIQNIFVAGGGNQLNIGAGAFYNYRRDGLNIMVEVWWAGFFGTGPYRGLNETDFEMESVESELSVVFGSLVLMWSIPLTSFLAFEVGFGLGFGGVFGGLYRTEAYPAPEGWTACNREGDPDPTYCDTSSANGGVGNYDRLEGAPEPYNFSGGVPPLWFWVDLPRVAVRIKPLRQFQIRIEGGFAAYAFHFGGSVALGF